MAWRAVAKLSLSAQVKELCWAERRLAIGYPYSITLIQNKKLLLLSYFVQKYEKVVNEPLSQAHSINDFTLAE